MEGNDYATGGVPRDHRSISLEGSNSTRIILQRTKNQDLIRQSPVKERVEGGKLLH